MTFDRPVAFSLSAALALALGCGGSSGSSSSPGPLSGTPTAARTDDARAYMLGRGVARDYRKAAALYAERCRDGCGDLAACETWLDLSLQQRGMSVTAATFSVAARLCDRKVVEACLIAAMAGVRDKAALEGLPDRAALQTRCDGGDVRACRAELGTDMGLSDSSSHAERMRDLEERVCLEADYLPACIASVNSWYATCQSGEIFSAPRGKPCVDARVAWLTGITVDPTPTKRVWSKVEAACSEGDADACRLVPGREIDPRVLCEAGDFGTCERLAEIGDAHAAAVGCTGGLGELCNPPQDTPHHGIAPILRTACEDGSKEACDAIEKATPPRCP